MLYKFGELAKTPYWRNPLLLGMAFLFLIPPLGVLILIGTGISYLFYKTKRKELFKKDLFSFFFIILTLASIGASLSDWRYAYVPLMLIGYLGIYHFVIDKITKTDSNYFFWIMILGGLYLYGFDWFHKGLMAIGIHLGFLGYLTGGVLLGDKPTTRLYGSTYNPNFAMYLLLFALAFITVYLIEYLQKRDYNRTLVFLPLWIIIFMGIIQTGSRSGYAGILLLILFFFYKLNWRILPVILTWGMTNLDTIYYFMPRHSLIDFSLNDRLHIWLTSLKIFLTHPLFGVTPAGFSEMYYKIEHVHIQHAHNIFLAFFTEYGVLGGISFIMLFINVIKKWGELTFYNNTTKTDHFFVFTLPIILITGLMDHPNYSPQIALPTIILLSLFIKHLESRKQQNTFC